MPHFVGGFGNKHTGYPKINLDHVARVEPIIKGEGGYGYRCFDAKGDDVGRVGDLTEEHPQIKGLIPNIHDIVYLRFWTDTNGVGYERNLILAWSIDEHWATPVLCEQPGDHEVFCYEQCVHGDTTYVFPDDCTCRTFEEARAYAGTQVDARERAREVREQAHHGTP